MEKKKTIYKEEKKEKIHQNKFWKIVFIHKKKVWTEYQRLRS